MRIQRVMATVVGAASLVLTAASAAAGEAGGDGDKDHGWAELYRMDCRYHNVEKHHGVDFCYASALYRAGEWREVRDVHLGVGCDNQTLFNDRGIATIETTLDRLSPKNAAVPGVEVFPQGQLLTEGTYTSVLDIPAGRFSGLCYVKRAGHPGG